MHPKIGHHDIYPRLPLCHQKNVGHFPQQAKSWIRRFFYRLVSQQQLRSQGSAAFLPKLCGKELPCITLFSEGSKPPNGTNSIHGHKSSGLVFTTSSHHPRRRRTSPPRHGPRGHTGSLRTQHGAQTSMRPPGLAPDLQTRHKGTSPTSKNPLCDLAFAWHGHGCQCGKTDQGTKHFNNGRQFFFLEQILIMNDTQKLDNILLFQLLLSMTISSLKSRRNSCD